MFLTRETKLIDAVIRDLPSSTYLAPTVYPNASADGMPLPDLATSP